MKIQVRLIVLFFFLIIVFAAGLYFLHQVDVKKLDEVFRNKVKESSEVFNNILKLKGASLEAMVFDYTYWDEMVKAINENDTKWIASMETKDVLDNYNVSAAWVYRLDSSNLFTLNNVGIPEFNAIPIPADVFGKVLERLQKEHFCHFFINTTSGFMEIRGATIHSTYDPQRNTSPRGYFFAGCLWSPEYLKELSGFITGVTAMATLTEKEPFVYKPSVNTGIISFAKILPAWDDTPLVKIYVQVKSPMLKELNQSYKDRLVLFVVFSLLMFIIPTSFIFHWVNLPLQAISRTLREEDSSYISKLQSVKTEFGDIANLISRFFDQREMLIREIGQRKLIEEALREAKDYTDNVLKSMIDTLIVVNPNGTIKSVNKATLDLLGYTEEEVVNKPFIIILGEQPFKVIKFKKLLKDGFVRDYDINYWTKTGERIPVSFSGSILRDKKGRLLGFVGIARDMREIRRLMEKEKELLITANKRAGELEVAYNKLRETQEMLIQFEKLSAIGLMGAGIAHELNSPLAGILSLIRFYKAKKDVSSREHDDLKDIEEAVLHMSKIVKDLRDFSRKSKGEIVDLNCNEVIESTLSFSLHELGKKEIVVEKNYDAKLPMVKGDKGQLQQVVLNMITNARDALPNKGVFKISTKTVRVNEARFVEMEFSDNGCGISKENLKYIFDPFFTTKRPGGGVGLGLSIVHNIIQNHNGQITLNSEAGKGTTFIIRIPAVGK